jgi:hypothetical protein
MRFTWAVLSTLEAGPDLEQGGGSGGSATGLAEDAQAKAMALAVGVLAAPVANGLGRSGPLNFMLSEFEPPRVHERT